MSNPSRSLEYDVPPSRAMGRNLPGSTVNPFSLRTSSRMCTLLTSPRTSVVVGLSLPGAAISWNEYN